MPTPRARRLGAAWLAAFLVLGLQVGVPGAADAVRPVADVTAGPDWVDLPDRCTDDGYPVPVRCRIVGQRRSAAPVVVLWGDSHAWQVVPALRAAVRARDVGLVSFLYGGCPPMRVVTPRQVRRANGCERFGTEVLGELRRMVERGRDVRLVVAASWELYHDVTDPPDAADQRWPGTTTPFVTENAHRALAGMPRAFRELGRLGIATDVVAMMPMLYQGADCPGRACTMPRRSVLKDQAENLRTIRSLREELSGSGRLVRPARVLCDDVVCRGRVAGAPLYLDRLHIGARASLRLAPLFAPTVDALTQ